MKEEKSASDKILEFLKEVDRASTTKIANSIKIDYTYATKLLNELEKGKKVKKKEETIATYWELKIKKKEAKQ